MRGNFKNWCGNETGEAERVITIPPSPMASIKAYITLPNGDTVALSPGSNILGRGNDFQIHDRRVRYYSLPFPSSYFLCC